MDTRDLLRRIFLGLAALLSCGVVAVFAHLFLESKPFKLIQPPWLSTLLTWVSIAVSVGSVALSWRLLRRHPYAIPLTASCLTLLAVVLVAHLLCRMASGGSGEGDFGWKAATDELVLEARGLLKPVVGISTFLGLIGFGLGRMRPLQ